MMGRVDRTSDSTRHSLATGLVILGALSRLLPHPPNMTSVGAMGLFSGSRLKMWQALSLPVLCMAITDPILGKLHGYAAFSWETPIIYASLMFSVLIGRSLARNGSATRVGIAALLCSTQFFVITNFAVWAMYGLYPHTWSGLAACYVAALPFFGRTLVGDLLYAAILFGVYALVSRRIARLDTEMVHERLSN